MAQLSVQAMLFLDTRPMARNIGSLLVALSDGNIQIWSHHPETTSVKGSFNAIHMAGDQVTAMATDKNNFYLFTGTTYGYVKIWLIADYWYVMMSFMIFMGEFPLITAHPLARLKKSMRMELLLYVYSTFTVFGELCLFLSLLTFSLA